MTAYIRIFLLLFFSILHFQVQAADTASYRACIKRTFENINIDGNLEERTWKESCLLTGFTNKWPTDTGKARFQTKVMLAYNEDYLYIGAICYTEKKPVVQTLKRDNDPWNNDGFYVVLDPIGQKLSGFLFGVNAGGAQSDGIVQGDNLSMEWDAKWYSEVNVHDSFYTVEIGIPLVSLRFNKDAHKWGINFVRSDISHNCYSNWKPAPLELYGYNINYTGELDWPESPKARQSENILQPYINSSLNNNFDASSTNVLNFKAGLDAKLKLHSSLSLDLTANPDFSQVEVDQQILNLDRFNPLLPEKRSFFLENSDLFTNFGVGNLRPFISRKIGLTDDGALKTILGGARMSGNLNKDLRIGVMDIQEGPYNKDNGLNYFVGVFEQKVFHKSSIKGILTNKDDFNSSKSNYNRLAGLELNFNSDNNINQASAKFHYSFNNISNKADQLLLLYYGYFKKVNSVFYYTDLGDNFDPEVGFSPYNLYYDLSSGTFKRKGYKQIYNSTTKIFSTHSTALNNISLTASAYGNTYSDLSFMEGRNQLAVTANFKNTSQLTVGSDQHLTNVPFATQYVGEKVNAGNYWFSVYSASYHTDTRKDFSLSVSSETGNYFGGYRYALGAGINIRNQPLLNIGLGTNYDHINLNRKSFRIFLFNATMDVNFSRNFFWTTFLQYNTQLNNFNINSRIQWRFHPMSDLYLVYTDNYQTDMFQPKNRVITLKVNYWLHL